MTSKSSYRIGGLNHVVKCFPHILQMLPLMRLGSCKNVESMPATTIVFNCPSDSACQSGTVRLAVASGILVCAFKQAWPLHCLPWEASARLS